MCTLLTVSSDQYSRQLEEHIRQDAASNPDGFACLLMQDGEASGMMRAMDIDAILLMLRNMPWDRMFLHSRYATQGTVRLDTTHGWAEDGVFYMHNGCLSTPEADFYEVDSQAIGGWIREGGVEYAVQRLKTEHFSNVFMIDIEAGYYTVSRSNYGSLYTDGLGNYATNPVGAIFHPVDAGTVDYWMFDTAEETLPDLPLAADYVIEDDGLDTIDPDNTALDTVDELERIRRKYGHDVLSENGIGSYVSPSMRRKVCA